MVLVLLKWLQETIFYETKKEVIIKHELSTKEKFILRRKEGLMNIKVRKS